MLEYTAYNGLSVHIDRNTVPATSLSGECAVYGSGNRNQRSSLCRLVGHLSGFDQRLCLEIMLTT